MERNCQTFYGKICAMFNASGVDSEIRNGIWAECASTESFYENRLINKATHQSPLQLMFKTQFQSFNNLQTFGEMCVVTTKKSIQGKLYDSRTVGLFVDYPQSHADDVYRIFNLRTTQIIKSRDLTWLNLRYANWNKSKNNIKIRR